MTHSRLGVSTGPRPGVDHGVGSDRGLFTCTYGGRVPVRRGSYHLSVGDSHTVVGAVTRDPARGPCRGDSEDDLPVTVTVDGTHIDVVARDPGTRLVLSPPGRTGPNWYLPHPLHPSVYRPLVRTPLLPSVPFLDTLDSGVQHG